MSGYDDEGSDHPVCVRAGDLPAGEPLVGAAVGGRDLPTQFTFTTFCDWIRHALEEELERSWRVKMNGVGVPEGYGLAAG
jgi:hypothetical protein